MPDRGTAGSRAPEALRRALERLLGPVESLDRLDVSERGAGTGGESFVATVGGRRCYVKHVPVGALRLISLADEFALLESVAADEIAPRPVALDAGTGLLVTEFLDGFVPLAPAELRDRTAIGGVAALLRRLHALRALAPARAAGEIAASYIDALGGSDALAPFERRRAVEFVALAAAFDARSEERVACHGDAIASNVMRREPGRAGPVAWRLIDFEYAQLAPPIFDLATVSFMNDFGPADDARLLAEYYGPEVPFHCEDFATVRRLVTLMAHFWACAQRVLVPSAGRYVLGGDDR